MKLLIPALVALFFLSWGIGAGRASWADLLRLVSGSEVSDSARTILLELRLPRLLAAVLAGGMLGAAGCATQNLFRNDLASPHVLGVVNAAALGAAAGLFLPGIGLIVPAMVSAALVLGILFLITLISWFFTSVIHGNKRILICALLLLTVSDNALWFMRDLTLLFLLSPLLCRLARYLLPLLLMMSLMPAFTAAFRPDFNLFFSPYAVALFCFGCALGSTRDDVRRAMLRFCSLPLVLLYLAVTAAGVYFGIDILGKEGADVTSKPLIVSLISFCVFYQLARYLELHLPALARFALAYAPVTFLTFATHSLIYMFAIPDDWATSEGFLLCLPLLIFALQALLFALLKPRLVRSSAGRFALHLFAHYKARPDDLEPAPQAVADSADGSAQRDGARP